MGRTPDELLADALNVIDRAQGYAIGPILPLFSGGHDSTCACHVASRHPKFRGEVFHIDTGIGSKATRKHVEDTARGLGWKLNVYKSPSTYEQMVRHTGFPGPGGHKWTYIRLKDRCVDMMLKGKGRAGLITGARQQESVRRMGYVDPIRHGDTVNEKKTGRTKVVRLNRVWVNPCFDWSGEEQRAYMEEFDLPTNPVKLALGMSGECLCGAFAAPGELDRIRHHLPDVAEEIDRLAAIARGCGKHAVWGTRPDRKKGVQAAASGPLCSTCDLRAAAAGVVFK
jgi:3'-phosphoadenosine 5'-phosphosulfate sulfotransferase (PAPS reductase)/FAD synthetase